jgi:O-antigen/teichoic acid export membrane protein
MRMYKQAILYVPSRIGPALISFFALSIYSRHLIPSEYGYFATASAMISIFETVASDWLGTITNRFYNQYKNKLSDFFNTLGEFQSGALLIPLIVTGVLWLFGLFRVPILRMITLGLLCVPITGIKGILLEGCRFDDKPLQYSIGNIIFSGFNFLISIACIYSGVGVFSLIWGLIGGNLISVIYLILIMRVKLSSFLKVPHVKTFKENKALLMYGLPGIPMWLASWVLTLSDRVMLEKMRSTAEVGLYAIPYSIGSQSIAMVYSLLTLPFFPRLIRMYEKDGKSSAEKYMSHMTKYYFLICLPIVAMSMGLSKDFIRLFLNERYAESYKVLPVITFSLFFHGLLQFTSYGYNLEKKMFRYMWMLWTASLLNFLLNLYFIPRFGYVGAAYTTFIAYFILWVITTIDSRKYLAWTPPVKPIIISIAGSAACYYIIVLALKIIKL